MMPAPELTSLDDALNTILSAASTLEETESLPLDSALNRILAEDVTVPADVPPAHNSAVDGYAIRCSDLIDGQPLPVSARIPAGTAPTALMPGTAARIFTGASVPAGADAVIMQEQTRTKGDSVLVDGPAQTGQNIRPRGQDLTRGSLALARGARLRPQELGLLASLGLPRISVQRRMRVAVFATGDELVDPGQPLQPGQIYNTNRFTLNALLTGMNCEVITCSTLVDTLKATVEALRDVAGRADLIITSGGVSVGEEDHVRAALNTLGELSLWRLAIKPGKPLAFGRIGSTPVLGLPGNPAAVFVTFLMVAAPFIRQSRGQPVTMPSGLLLPAAFRVDKPSIRREFMRARRELHNGQWQITVYPNQSSGVLSSACWADGLAVVPENSRVNHGDPVVFYSFDELMG